MANLSKFHAVFSSSTLIRLDKDAFEGHLCHTVNNFVKQNKSNLLSPLIKRRPPQNIKHIRNTRVSHKYLLLANLAARRCTLSTLSLLYFCMGPKLHKRVNQRKVSSLLKLIWAALQVATQKPKLGVSLVCHGCNVF